MTAVQAKADRDTRLWTADQFLDFALTRPDEERWQLVDGLAIMMVPPTFTHQKIGRNVFALLDRAITAHRPGSPSLLSDGRSHSRRGGFQPGI
jgi:Uma2 family endonuclease